MLVWEDKKEGGVTTALFLLIWYKFHFKQWYNEENDWRAWNGR